MDYLKIKRIYEAFIGPFSAFLEYFLDAFECFL